MNKLIASIAASIIPILIILIIYGLYTNNIMLTLIAWAILVIPIMVFMVIGVSYLIYDTVNNNLNNRGNKND